MIIINALYAGGAFIVTGTLLRTAQWLPKRAHTRRKVTCYFVVQLADGSILPPQKRVLVVEQNTVTTSFHGLMCKFFVPDTGSKFLYEVTTPQPLTANITPLSSQQLRTILDTQFISAFAHAVDPPSLFQRIFGKKAFSVFISNRMLLEEVEKSGVVEGDFIIFSRKMWEELKTK